MAIGKDVQDVVLDGLIPRHILAEALRHEPLVLEKLVVELGSRELLAHRARDRPHDRLILLLKPLVGDELFFLTLLIRENPVLVEVVEEPARLVFLERRFP